MTKIVYSCRRFLFVEIINNNFLTFKYGPDELSVWDEVRAVLTNNDLSRTR